MRTDFKDYYRILGVMRDASSDEIKMAYRNLAKRYHPDRKGGNTVKFQEINDAQEVLLDSTKRRDLDSWIFETETAEFERKKKAEEDLAEKLRQETLRREAVEEEERVAKAWAKKSEEWKAKQDATPPFSPHPIWDDPAHDFSMPSVSGASNNQGVVDAKGIVAIILLFFGLLVAAVVISSVFGGSESQESSGVARDVVVEKDFILPSTFSSPTSAAPAVPEIVLPIPTFTPVECALVIYTPKSGHVEEGLVQSTVVFVSGGITPIGPSRNQSIKVWLETKISTSAEWVRNGGSRKFNIPADKELSFSDSLPLEFYILSAFNAKYRLAAESDCGVFYGNSLEFSELHWIAAAVPNPTPTLAPTPQPTPGRRTIPFMSWPTLNTNKVLTGSVITTGAAPPSNNSACRLVVETPKNLRVVAADYGRYAYIFYGGSIEPVPRDGSAAWWWLENRSDPEDEWWVGSEVEIRPQIGSYWSFTERWPIKIADGQKPEGEFEIRLVARNHCGVFYGEIRRFNP